MDEPLTIGQVSARSGVATSALRFYEEQGLIAALRTDSGHRRYPRGVLRCVAFIVFAQKVGLSLEEIRVELAKLPRNRAPERADWAKLSKSWTTRIDERIRSSSGEGGHQRSSDAAAFRSIVAASPIRGSRRAPRPRSPLLDGQLARYRLRRNASSAAFSPTVKRKPYS